MKSFNSYFSTSPKREALLNHFFKQETHPGRKKVLLSLCKTRWSERDGGSEVGGVGGTKINGIKW